jgi:hypothetical protein
MLPGLFALALLVAPETPPPPPPKTAAATPAKPRIVCREETPTGTRFAKRVCRPAEDWDARAERARDDIRAIQSAPRPKICSPTGAGC